MYQSSANVDIFVGFTFCATALPMYATMPATIGARINS
jgi:hypothetical protein